MLYSYVRNRMTTVPPLGAINKTTGAYVYAKIANKKDEYICPECDKDLILCRGEIRIPHFRHNIDSVNPCHHYSSPNESQIHKDAKLLMKSLLENKVSVSFIRRCCGCNQNEEFEIPEITESSTIQLEYRFEYKGTKIADVAYIDDGDILCIFEICNTNKTRGENRPEPWFEIDATTLIKIANDNNLTTLQIPCIRCEKCEDCIKETLKKIKRRRESFSQKFIINESDSYNCGSDIYRDLTTTLVCEGVFEFKKCWNYEFINQYCSCIDCHAGPWLADNGPRPQHKTEAYNISCCTLGCGPIYDEELVKRIYNLKIYEWIDTFYISKGSNWEIKMNGRGHSHPLTLIKLLEQLITKIFDCYYNSIIINTGITCYEKYGLNHAILSNPVAQPDNPYARVATSNANKK